MSNDRLQARVRGLPFNWRLCILLAVNIAIWSAIGLGLL